MKLSAEDIAFWILILAAISVLLWLLKGSPTLENALISAGFFVASSEAMLWRKYFALDKNAAVSFTRLKCDVGNIRNDVGNIKNEIGNIRNDVGNIKNEIGKINNKMNKTNNELKLIKNLIKSTLA